MTYMLGKLFGRKGIILADSVRVQKQQINISYYKMKNIEQKTINFSSLTSWLRYGCSQFTSWNRLNVFLAYIHILIAFLIKLQVSAFDNTFLDLWASRDVWPVGWQMTPKEIPPLPADVIVRCPKCHWISFMNILQMQIVIIYNQNFR